MLTGEGAGTLFKIDEKSGDIHATKRLDREEKAYYILHAKAVNRFTNEALEGQSEFIIKIHDINDNEPRFTKELYMARVPEMSDIGENMLCWSQRTERLTKLFAAVVFMSRVLKGNWTPPLWFLMTFPKLTRDPDGQVSGSRDPSAASFQPGLWSIFIYLVS